MVLRKQRKTVLNVSSPPFVHDLSDIVFSQEQSEMSERYFIRSCSKCPFPPFFSISPISFVVGQIGNERELFYSTVLSSDLPIFFFVKLWVLSDFYVIFRKNPGNYCYNVQTGPSFVVRGGSTVLCRRNMEMLENSYFVSRIPNFAQDGSLFLFFSQ